MPHTMMRPFAAISILLACASAAHAAGGGLMHGKGPRPTSDYGHDLVKIGRPHNRDTLASERVDNIDWPDFGGVGHRYRIARTEMTATQWLGFVNAYDAYWVAAGGSRFDSSFTSQFIRASNFDPSGPPGYYIVEGGQQAAVTMSWYMAARYCNWLHNDKAPEQAAFESGAYDTSTFGVVPGVGYFDQMERSPGARFWIPNLDEWTKATYYDPNRYGEGEDGYWSNMAMQNEPLISGPPGVGETSAGHNFPPGYDVRATPVGSYPDVLSPWGLLDTSGGVTEWTETLRNDFVLPNGAWVSPARIARASEAGQDWLRPDTIDPYPWGGGNPNSGLGGLRIASAVPAPGGVAVALFGVGVLARRRRRAGIGRTS